jgi:hypothetical protein
MTPSYINDDGVGADDRTPYEILLGEIDQVLSEWRLLIRPEPWAALPPSRLIDSMPEILPKLVRLASGGAVEVDEELKERIAREHGFARREDEVPIEGVTEEWHALKRACRRVLARHGIVQGLADDVMIRLELLIDDAVGYTLRGYYREELDTLKGRGLERRDRGGDRRRGSGNRRGRDEA